MRRVFLTLSVALVLFVGVVTPAYASLNLPILNPDFAIIPTQCQACPCGYVGILQTIQNVINAGIAIGIVAFVLVTVYAGITFMMNPTNPEIRTRARQMFLNIIVGMVIVLAAWLIVDFVMKLLYDPGHTDQGVEFGPWNEILSPAVADSWCIEERAPTPLSGLGGIATGILDGGISVGGGGGGGGTGGVTVPSITGPNACNASTLSRLANQSGFSLTQAQANTFACIASPESSCGARVTNYNWNRGSSAAGAFQVLLSNNARFYENATCRRAAGLSATQPLNCAAGFRGGNPIPGSAIAQRCVNAASNLACSLAAAQALNQANGGSFRDWTADSHSRTQRACIAQYAH